MAGYLLQTEYAKVSAPLVKLTRMNVQFAWGQTEQEAFDSLNNFLVSNKVMAQPATSKPFKLCTDVCD